MKHSECKKCKLREGDCGHHFKMDGITDYDIPRQSACDQYDNCMFFKPEAKAKQNSKTAKNEWIPIKYRPMTSEERKELAEHYGIEYCDTLEEKAFDCPMPEDGQRILLSRSWGVDIDVADNDIDGEGFIFRGLEGNGDWDGVDAWMPLPESYKKEGEV